MNVGGLQDDSDAELQNWCKVAPDDEVIDKAQRMTSRYMLLVRYFDVGTAKVVNGYFCNCPKKRNT